MNIRQTIDDLEYHITHILPRRLRNLQILENLEYFLYTEGGIKLETITNMNNNKWDVELWHEETETTVSITRHRFYNIQTGSQNPLEFKTQEEVLNHLQSII